MSGASRGKGGRGRGGGRSAPPGRANTAGARGAGARKARAKRPSRPKDGRNKGGKRKGGRGGAASRGLGGDRIEGRQAVRELLLAGRRPTREVLLADDLDPAPVLTDIRDLAAEARVPVTTMGRAKLDAAAHTEAAQGVVATAAPLPEVDLADLARPPAGRPAPFLVVADGVTDPGNLGALLRSAEVAGATGVVLGRHRAVHVTPTVAKAAAGAIEHLPIALAGGIPRALADLGTAGVWRIGLDAASDTPVWHIDAGEEAVVLVVGAEGRGLSRLAAERCDQVVAIPLGGRLDALNVASAGTVACFEVARGRRSPRSN